MKDLKNYLPDSLPTDPCPMNEIFLYTLEWDQAICLHNLGLLNRQDLSILVKKNLIHPVCLNRVCESTETLLVCRLACERPLWIVTNLDPWYPATLVGRHRLMGHRIFSIDCGFREGRGYAWTDGFQIARPSTEEALGTLTLELAACFDGVCFLGDLIIDLADFGRPLILDVVTMGQVPVWVAPLVLSGFPSIWSGRSGKPALG